MSDLSVNGFGAMPYKESDTVPGQKSEAVDFIELPKTKKKDNEDFSAADALGFQKTGVIKPKQSTHSDEEIKIDDNGGRYIPRSIKQGEYYYQVIQSEYGLTNGKEIVDVVHAIKAYNGVDLRSHNVPEKLKLPVEVVLGEDKTYHLNIEYDTNRER